MLPNMSLDDGVRLEIRASGDGSLWVIELTLWYSTHYLHAHRYSVGISPPRAIYTWGPVQYIGKLVNFGVAIEVGNGVVREKWPGS